MFIHPPRNCPHMWLSWPKNDARKSRPSPSKGGPDRLAPTLSPLHQGIRLTAQLSSPLPLDVRCSLPLHDEVIDLVVPLPWRATKLTCAHSSPLPTRPSLQQLASFSSSLWKWRRPGRIVAARDRRVKLWPLVNNSAAIGFVLIDPIRACDASTVKERSPLRS